MRGIALKTLMTSLVIGCLSITAFAANSTYKETPVSYSGLGNQVYEVKVPSKLKPSQLGEVQLLGTWDSTKKVIVSTDDYIVMTNSIDNKTKNININFEDIILEGNNTLPVEKTETISVDAITDALFGVWSGTIIYNIQLADTHEHTWETDYIIDVEPTCLETGSKSIHCSTCDEIKDKATVGALGHLFTTKKCVRCNVTLADGLYNEYNRLCSMTQSGINITKTFTQDPDLSFNPYCKDTTSPWYAVTYRYPKTTMIVVQDGITGFGWNTFYKCTFLKQVVLPESVTSISISMFLDSSVEKVNIPASVKSMDANVFMNCTNLKEIYYKGVTYTGETALTNALKANGVTMGANIFTGSSFEGK